MKKLIGAFGVVVLGMSAVVATALAGDAVYIKQPQFADLNTDAKTKALRKAMNGPFKGLGIDDLGRYGCSRHYTPERVSSLRKWYCQAHQVVVGPSDSEALDIILKGGSSELLQKEASVRVGVEKIRKKKAHNAFTVMAFGLDMDDIAEFECGREKAGPIKCSYLEIVTGTPSQWRTDFNSGGVFGTIGKVEEE